MGVAGGGDLQLGPYHQRVVELAVGAHGTPRDGAAVRRHEVHQPEAQALDARVRGDGEHLAQRAMGFHQRVQRHSAAAASGQRLGGPLHVGQSGRLGQHQVGRKPLGAQHRGQHVTEGRVLHRQQAHAHAAVHVGRAAQQFGDQLRVLDFATHRCPVLVVQGDVEDRAQFGLQGQALTHAGFHAGVVVAHGQGAGHGFVGLEQGQAGVQWRVGRVHAGSVGKGRCRA